APDGSPAALSRSASCRSWAPASSRSAWRRRWLRRRSEPPRWPWASAACTWPSACSSREATVAEPARRRRPERPPAGSPLRGVRSEPASDVARELDALLHHRMRLGMVSALAASESPGFNDLKTLLQTSDGNLSVHARKLEDAGYVTCTKSFENRRPRTDYRLTARGRQALGRYLGHMEAIIRAAKDTLGR